MLCFAEDTQHAQCRLQETWMTRDDKTAIFVDSFLRSGTGYFVSFNNSIDLVHFRLTYRFAKVNTIRK